MARKKRGFTLKDLVIGGLLAFLVVNAIREQLRRPPEERTWHGRIYGIPYDFRLPTPERVRATYWNDQTSQVLLPHAFGLGWGLNFYPLVYPRVKELSEQTSR